MVWHASHGADTWQFSVDLANDGREGVCGAYMSPESVMMMQIMVVGRNKSLTEDTGDADR
jgi:hypothetical protein